MDLMVQFLGALQKGGVVPEPLQGWGSPFTPTQLPPSPWNFSSLNPLVPPDAPSRGMKETPTKELCAGTVSDQQNLADCSCTAAPPHFYGAVMAGGSN